ncbi:MAG: NAD(P)H-dependent oxidoreductase [Gallionella sp.]|nr:NAD(P)H-dependent oxidoreductase [Gallionella sp.]
MPQNPSIFQPNLRRFIPHKFRSNGKSRLNSALLCATARLAPKDISIQVFQGIGDLPLFNPDIEFTDPAPVVKFRAQVIAADALIIASPEYAHGVTGVLKNALDWLVGSEAFVNKPIALFNASPSSVYAPAALKEIVRVMSARVVDEASIDLPIRGAKLDEDGIYEDVKMSAAIRTALQALTDGVLLESGLDGLK